MLAQLGAVQFTIAPINYQELDHEATASYAEHQVVGVRPPLEFVGEGPETYTIRGEMYPKHFQGGLNALQVLSSMRLSGQPYFFIRGDGVPLGWVVILSIHERSNTLAPDGVGRKIQFDIAMKVSDAPDPATINQQLLSLFE